MSESRAPETVTFATRVPSMPKPLRICSATGNALDNSIYGSANADTLVAGAGRDRLFGYDGNDEMHGDEGDDLIVGMNGDDRLFGGEGADRILGAAGHEHHACRSHLRGKKALGANVGVARQRDGRARPEHSGQDVQPQDDNVHILHGDLLSYDI